jgi:DNA (cytosine-5)-methyltransferase 1
VRELALFAGAGGGILGGKLLGWRTVCAVEFASYPRSVLLARQRDGQLSRFPIWDDVTTFDGKPWRGRVDVVSGGFPCQDISSAGKGAGLDGARSGLWSEMARIIGEVRPRFVFVENSPMLTSRGLGVVLGDLASMGFNAEWGVLGARDAGAPHKRDRIWIVGRARARNDWYANGADVCSVGEVSKWGADAGGSGRISGAQFDRYRIVADADDMGNGGCRGSGVCADSEVQHAGRGDGDGREFSETSGRSVANSSLSGSERGERHARTSGEDRRGGVDDRAWAAEPDVGRVAHGVASRVDRLAAIGNGQVPQCAALAWRVLSERLGAR